MQTRVRAKLALVLALGSVFACAAAEVADQGDPLEPVGQQDPNGEAPPGTPPAPPSGRDAGRDATARDAGQPDARLDATTRDAADATVDAADASKADGSTSIGSGTFQVLQRDMGVWISNSSAVYGVFQSGVAPVPAGCSKGPFPSHPQCLVQQCVGGPPTSTPLPNLGGGVVTITGLAFSLDAGADSGITPQGIVMNRNSSGTYVGPGANYRVFNGGETITLSSTGDQVPAISGLSLVAPPAQVHVTTWLRPDGGTMPVISRASPLTIAWSNPGPGSVRISLSSSEQGVRYVSMRCEYPLAPGSATIPTSILQLLAPPSDAGTSSRYMKVESLASASVDAGGYVTTLEVRGNALFDDGTSNLGSGFDVSD
jgi:hypothetical protein